MSFALIVYLVGILSPLKSSLVFILVASIVAAGALAIVSLSAEDDFNSDTRWNNKHKEEDIKYYKSSIKWLRCCAWSFAVCGLLNIIIPTKDTAYVMIAAYGVEGIVTDDRVQALGGKSLDVIEKWLDEMAPDSNKGDGE